MRTILNSLAPGALTASTVNVQAADAVTVDREDRGLRRALQRLGQPHFEGSDTLNNPLTL